MKFTVGVALLVFMLTIAADGRPTEGDGELVLVRELLGKRTRRSTESRLPSHIHTQFKVAGETVLLRLERNTDIDTNVPFTFAKNKHEKEYIPVRKDIAFYQDDYQGAAITVTAKKTSNGQHHNQLEGSFNFNDSHYVIQPVDITSLTLPYNRLDGVPHLIKKVQLSKVYRTTAKQHYEELSARLNRSQLREGTPEHRKKRDAEVASYHVELLFVLDHTIYDYWLAKASDRNDALSKIKYYYLHIMNGIDLAYKSIDSSVWGFMITPFLKEYYIAETAEESTWTETSIQRTGTTVEETIVNATAILEKMSVWKTQDGRSWKNPDHAMLWTRYNIYGSSEGTVGFAFTTGVCLAGLGVSVIEESGLYSWAIAAHELGHSLGAHHDGDGDSCSASDMFLMSATIGQITVSTRSNAFTFSPCTLLSFKDLFNGVTDDYPRVCLTNQVCSHGVSTEGQDKLPGVTYSLDEQCAMHFGAGYAYYVYNGDTNETLCYTMHCVDPPRKSIYVLKRGATYGTPCGNNKCCYKGECVRDCSYPKSSSASTCTAKDLNTDVPEGCTDSGDRFKINGVYTTCAELVAYHTHMCFTWPVARDELCCESCHKAGVINQTLHYVTLTPTPPSSTTETVTAGSTVPLSRTTQTTTSTHPTTTFQTARTTKHKVASEDLSASAHIERNTISSADFLHDVSSGKVMCYACGSYKNNMRQECERGNFNTTVCDECWIYRQDLNGTEVTYARGCRSGDIYDMCDDFSSERCFRVGVHTVCRQCCTSDSCNGGTLTGMRSSASVTTASVFLVYFLSVTLASPL